MRQFSTAVLALAALVIALPQVRADERLVTLPVVVGQVDGANGSSWMSLTRILRTSDDPVWIRRVWVALPGGGYLDNPETAPSWTVGVDQPDGVVRDVLGAELLNGGNGQIGAAMLAVDGSAHVLERIFVVRESLPDPMCGVLRLQAQGQMVPAFSEPLTGPCFIPWGNRWNSFRNNLGIVNPNGAPMTFSVSGTPLYSTDPGEMPPPIEVALPAYGFIQLNNVLARLEWQYPIVACKFIITVEPEDSRPYYAYGSMVYSPTNDPEFIAPVSGTVGGLP
jgi:hypothetical protein